MTLLAFGIKYLPMLATIGSCSRAAVFSQTIWAQCGNASFVPKFIFFNYWLMTTELNCLLFQGNSRTPKKTQYFHQVTGRFLDSTMPSDSHDIIEALIANPNISQKEHELV